MKTYRLPLFLQFSRKPLGLSDDEWFAVMLAVCCGTDDADAIYAAADQLGALNEVSVSFAKLGGSPAQAVKAVYDRAVQAGLATWNDRYPAEFGGVPTPFAKIPTDLVKRLSIIPEADSIDFCVFALVAAYDYQLNHRRDFVKGEFRFSKKLAADATGASFEDVEETLDELVRSGLLEQDDGFYRLIGPTTIRVNGKEAFTSFGKPKIAVDFGYSDVPLILGKTLD